VTVLFVNTQITCFSLSWPSSEVSSTFCNTYFYIKVLYLKIVTKEKTVNLKLITVRFDTTDVIKYVSVVRRSMFVAANVIKEYDRMDI
jgi:hypothetical protein